MWIFRDLAYLYTDIKDLYKIPRLKSSHDAMTFWYQLDLLCVHEGFLHL